MVRKKKTDGIPPVNPTTDYRSYINPDSAWEDIMRIFQIGGPRPRSEAEAITMAKGEKITWRSNGKFGTLIQISQRIGAIKTNFKVLARKGGKELKIAQAFCRELGSRPSPKLHTNVRAGQAYNALIPAIQSVVNLPTSRQRQIQSRQRETSAKSPSP